MGKGVLFRLGMALVLGTFRIPLHLAMCIPSTGGEAHIPVSLLGICIDKVEWNLQFRD